MKPLAQFVDELQREATARKVAPGGDWTTTASIESYDGQKTVLIVDPAFMRSAETKNRLAELYGQTLLRLRGVRLGVTDMVWAVARDADDPDRTAPADDPNRVEWLTVWAVDLEQTLGSFAAVRRRPGRPPTLTPWTTVDRIIEGRFVDAARLALHWTRRMAEDPLALLHELAGRCDEGSDDRAMIEHAIELGESDPELVESMPLRQWWQQERGSAL